MLYVYHQVYEPSLSVDGTTVTVVHFGEYRYLCEAKNALNRFLHDNFLEPISGISTKFVKDSRDTAFCDSYVTVLTTKVSKRQNTDAFQPSAVYA